MDDDIDPSNMKGILFALTSRCGPRQDIGIVRGIPSDEFDSLVHPDRKESGDMTVSTMLIDVTMPYHWKDEYPKVDVISDYLWDKPMNEWNLGDWEGTPLLGGGSISFSALPFSVT